MNPFISDFQRTVKKAIIRYAGVYEKDPTDVQLYLGLKSPDQNLYKVLVGYKPQKELSFNDIRGVKIDFSGKSLLVPGFIRDVIKSLEAQNSIPACKGSVIIYLKDDAVLLHLYNGQTPVQPVDLNALFGG